MKAFSCDDATTKDIEMGLGLTITRQALVEMGARLEAGDEPVREARFSAHHKLGNAERRAAEFDAPSRASSARLRSTPPA